MILTRRRPSIRSRKTTPITSRRLALTLGGCALDAASVVTAKRDTTIQVTAKRGQAREGATVFLPDATTPDAPKASAGPTQRGLASIVVSDVPANGHVQVLNTRGQFVAGGSGEVGKPLPLWFAAPHGETRYAVTTTLSNENTSPTTEVVVNAGKPSAEPTAPGVGTVSASGGRVVVPVTGTAGNVVTIRDHSDRVVAVKTLGSSGKAQLAFAPDARAKASTTVYSATHSSSDADSAPTDFRVTLP